MTLKSKMADGGHFENEIFFKFHLICLADHAIAQNWLLLSRKGHSMCHFSNFGSIWPFWTPYANVGHFENRPFSIFQNNLHHISCNTSKLATFSKLNPFDVSLLWFEVIQTLSDPLKWIPQGFQELKSAPKLAKIPDPTNLTT